MRYTNATRIIPDVQLQEIAKDVAWVLIIDYFRNSSLEAEASGLFLNGWSSHLDHDYYVLSKKKALDYIKANGLRLDVDLSTIESIRMIVYRPSHPHAIEPDRRPSAYHDIQNCGEKCFYCGNERVLDEACPAFLAVMYGAIENFKPIETSKTPDLVAESFPDSNDPISDAARMAADRQRWMDGTKRESPKVNRPGLQSGTKGDRRRS